jgi:hypothetical protein
MRDVDLVCGLDHVRIFDKGGDPNSDSWVLEGFASTPDLDADGETLVQKGLNFEPLIQHGWVNWDHDRTKLIGYPKTAGLRQVPDSTDKGLHVQLELLKGIPLAQNVWNIAKALEENKAPRELGLSIEGQRKEVGSNGRVLKADVLGLAVTPYAKNKRASARALIKGMTGATVDGEPYNPEDFEPPERLGTHFIQELSEAIKKAIDVSSDIGGTTQIGGDAAKREAIDRGKDAVVDMVSFDPCKVASLYDGRIPTMYVEACKKFEKLASQRDGFLTKGESALFLTMAGVPLYTALEYWDLV